METYAKVLFKCQIVLLGPSSSVSRASCWAPVMFEFHACMVLANLHLCGNWCYGASMHGRYF